MAIAARYRRGRKLGAPDLREIGPPIEGSGRILRIEVEPLAE